MKSLEELRAECDIFNLCWWVMYGEDPEAKKGIGK